MSIFFIKKYIQKYRDGTPFENEFGNAYRTTTCIGIKGNAMISSILYYRHQGQMFIDTWKTATTINGYYMII